MADPNIGEAVTMTLRERRGELADNVLNHNALLRKINQNGNADPVSGGRELVEELEYAENQNFMYYSGFEALSINQVDTFDSATYDWKQAAAPVAMSGREQRINMGANRSIDQLDRRLRNAEKTMANNLSIGIYSDGTGTNGKQITGLQALVADAPATGTVGGINRANFSFWRNSVTDFSADIGAAASASNIQAGMNDLWLKCLRGPDKPDHIVMDSNYFKFYWASLQTIQRISSEAEAAAGFQTLQYYGPGGRADVFYDDQVPASHMYFLNTDYLFWRPHTDANIEPLDRRDSLNQDAFVVPIIFMGNLTMSNAARQGVGIE